MPPPPVHKFSTANNRKLEFGLVVTRDRTGRVCCLCRSGDAYDRQNYINKEENDHQFSHDYNFFSF